MQQQQQQTLADILHDPNTDWSDIRNAIKAHGRGSFLGGTAAGGGADGKKKKMGVTTNAGFLHVLHLESMKPNGHNNNGRDGPLLLFHSPIINDDNDGTLMNKLLTTTVNDDSEDKNQSLHATEPDNSSISSDRSSPKSHIQINEVLFSSITNFTEQTSSNTNDNTLERRHSDMTRQTSNKQSTATTSTLSSDHDDDIKRQQLKKKKEKFFGINEVQFRDIDSTNTNSNKEENAMEDVESGIPNDNDLISTTSSEPGCLPGLNSTSADSGGSGGGRHRIPARHVPRSSSARAAGAGNPGRRLTRSCSTRGTSFTGSFRGSLEHVIEDIDANTDDLEDNDYAGEKEVQKVSSRRIMPAKFRRASLDSVAEDVQATLGDLAASGDMRLVNQLGLAASGHRPRLGSAASSRGSSYHNTKSLRSIHLSGFNSSLSSASILTNDFTMEGSVNMMDFGYSQTRGFTDSLSRSLAASEDAGTEDDNLSILVDADGFLSWGGRGSDFRSSLSSSSIMHRHRHHKRSNSADSLYSSLVDSDGFLGWNTTAAGPVAKGITRMIRSNSADSMVFSSFVDSDGVQGLSNNVRDELAASVGDLTASSVINDKELVGKGSVCSTVPTALEEPERSNVERGADNVQRIDNDECLKVCSKSWRIEDYEGDDTFDDMEPQNSDPRKFLLKRVGSKVASSARNLLSNQNGNSPKESIQTNEIKHILLKSQSLPIDNEKRSAPLGYAAFRSFIQGNSKKESDTKTSYPNVECDSRPAIWIKSEDGADISEIYK